MGNPLDIRTIHDSIGRAHHFLPHGQLRLSIPTIPDAYVCAILPWMRSHSWYPGKPSIAKMIISKNDPFAKISNAFPVPGLLTNLKYYYYHY
jgi:hypothetical protein